MDRSLYLMIPIIPVTKADMPEIAAITIGIVNARLLKIVAPPRCPEATRIWNNVNNTIKRQTDCQILPNSEHAFSLLVQLADFYLLAM